MKRYSLPVGHRLIFDLKREEGSCLFWEAEVGLVQVQLQRLDFACCLVCMSRLSISGQLSYSNL